MLENRVGRVAECRGRTSPMQACRGGKCQVTADGRVLFEGRMRGSQDAVDRSGWSECDFDNEHVCTCAERCRPWESMNICRRLLTWDEHVSGDRRHELDAWPAGMALRGCRMPQISMEPRDPEAVRLVHDY